jgi:hypothetical protein
LNAWKARVRALENPSPIRIRIYTVLDNLHVDYTKLGNFADDVRMYFPIAMVGNAVIDAHGRHDKGVEDKQSRISYHRKLDALQAQHIPYLYGRNDWTAQYWEVYIKLFLSDLNAGKCPQIIGECMHRKKDPRFKQGIRA